MLTNYRSVFGSIADRKTTNQRFNRRLHPRSHTPPRLSISDSHSYHPPFPAGWGSPLTESASGSLNEPALETILSGLRCDFSKLSARLRTVEHPVKGDSERVAFRIYYPALRDRRATVGDLIDTISLYLTNFALPRSEVQEVIDLYGKIPAEEFSLKTNALQQRAIDLFKKAQRATNRNGEAGELILYLLTEWILAAPQLLAKMALKTNPNMPVHGADGVHIGLCPKTKRAILYWGESKLYGDIGKAISEAVNSLVTAMSHDAVKHEITLIQRHIAFTGLTDEEKAKILSYLDPFDENSNHRLEASTCLLGFDFAGFQKLKQIPDADVDAIFEALLIGELEKASPKIAAALKAGKIDDRLIEIFFFPVPSVQELRDLFQAKIGWKL